MGMGMVGSDVDLPVHWVALPDYNVPAVLYCFDVCAEHRFNFVGSVARDQSDFANLLARVHDVKQFHQFVVLHRRTDFDADGILDAPEVLHMSALNLACAVADPDEVC